MTTWLLRKAWRFFWTRKPIIAGSLIIMAASFEVIGIQLTFRVVRRIKKYFAEEIAWQKKSIHSAQNVKKTWNSPSTKKPAKHPAGAKTAV